MIFITYVQVKMITTKTVQLEHSISLDSFMRITIANVGKKSIAACSQ